LNIHYIQCEILAKQLVGWESLSEMLRENQTVKRFVCEKLKIINFVRTHADVHQSAVPFLRRLVEAMVGEGCLSPEDLRQLVAVTLRQHAGTRSHFWSLLGSLFSSAPNEMRRSLFDTIVDSGVFSHEVLSFLVPRQSDLSGEQKCRLFDLLTELYMGSLELPKLELLGFIQRIVPKGNADLQIKCLGFLRERQHCEYALSVLHVCLRDIAGEQAELVFDSVIAFFAGTEKNKQQFLPLLARVVPRLPRGCPTQQLMELTRPLFDANSVAAAKFYEAILPALSFEVKAQLLKTVCAAEFQEANFSLLRELFKSVNGNTRATLSVGINDIWGLVFRTGNESVVVYLLGIYGDSEGSEFLTHFIQKCLNRLNSVGALKCLRVVLDILDWPRRSQNRYVCPDDMISVDLFGDASRAISVTADASYQEVVGQVASHTNSHRWAIVLTQDDVLLTPENWKVTRGMAIQVRFRPPDRGMVIPSVCPSAILMESANAARLMALLMAEDEDLAQHALVLLNRLPTLTGLRQMIDGEKDW
jgi:hypothetical protein